MSVEAVHPGVAVNPPPLDRAGRRVPRDADERARRLGRQRRAPRIQDDLGFSQSNLSWVVNAYLIAFGSFLLLAGRLGDLDRAQADVPHAASRSSRRASVLCGLADDQAC